MGGKGAVKLGAMIECELFEGGGDRGIRIGREERLLPGEAHGPDAGAHCLRISCRGVTGASHRSWQFVAGAPGSGGDVGAERYS